MVAHTAQWGRAIDVDFKGWELLADWSAGAEVISEVSAHLYQARRLGGAMTLFSDLRSVDPDLWEYVYDHPRLRIAWMGADLLGCRDMAQFQDFGRQSAAFKNLREISNQGLWTRVVLPVSVMNVKVLPDLVQSLLEATRGGSIELVPAGILMALANDTIRLDIPDARGESPLTPAPSTSDREREAAGGRRRNLEHLNPPVEEYVEALVAIYRNRMMPLRLISPLSWVAARVDSRQPLVSSPAAAGAEVAVLPNGNVYAGEQVVGVQHWRLGNVLQGPRDFRWERMDAMAELSSYSLKPSQCQHCDWRYRCGGADASVLLLEEAGDGGQRPEARGRGAEEAAGGHGGGALGQLFDLYCAPRKRLFEEILWGSAEAAANSQPRPGRERVSLREDGIHFEPVGMLRPASFLCAQPEIH